MARLHVKKPDAAEKDAKKRIGGSGGTGTPNVKEASGLKLTIAVGKRVFVTNKGTAEQTPAAGSSAAG